MNVLFSKRLQKKTCFSWTAKEIVACNDTHLMYWMFLARPVDVWSQLPQTTAPMGSEDLWDIAGWFQTFVRFCFVSRSWFWDHPLSIPIVLPFVNFDLYISFSFDYWLHWLLKALGKMLGKLYLYQHLQDSIQHIYWSTIIPVKAYGSNVRPSHTFWYTKVLIQSTNIRGQGQIWGCRCLSRWSRRRRLSFLYLQGI